MILDLDFSRVLNDIQDNHITELNCGGDRRVCRINTDKFGKQNKGRVIKFPRGACDISGRSKRPHSIKMNRREFQTWMAVKGTKAEKYFCPIRGRSDDFACIIMDYAQPVSSNMINNSVSEIENNIKDIIKFDESNSIYDIIPENVGKHPQYGRVLIDYPYGGGIRIEI